MDKEKLCVFCMNCRTKNEIVFCSIGKFMDKKLDQILLYVPEEFDCENFEPDEEVEQ